MRRMYNAGSSPAIPAAEEMAVCTGLHACGRPVSSPDSYSRQEDRQHLDCGRVRLQEKLPASAHLHQPGSVKKLECCPALQVLEQDRTAGSKSHPGR